MQVEPTVTSFFSFRYTKPGEWVLDLFCGSGTTLEAAVYLGRNVMGSDTRVDQIQATITRMDNVMRKENTVLKPSDQALNISGHATDDVPSEAKALSSSSKEAEDFKSENEKSSEDESESEVLICPQRNQSQYFTKIK